jgi:hypothetical protein
MTDKPMNKNQMLGKGKKPLPIHPNRTKRRSHHKKIENDFSIPNQDEINHILL